MGLVVNFSDFENKTGTSLSASDYLVGYTTDYNTSYRFYAEVFFIKFF
jgi:hypothetical protein